MIPTGSNAKQVEIARLRTISLNEGESPVARIEAARKLLQHHGPSQRNLPIIRRVIAAFVSSSDADVSERALKLRARLVKILDLKAVKLPPEIEEQPIDISEDSTNIDAIGGEPEVQKSSDVWERPAPPDTGEVLRIVYIVRDYTTCERGTEVWRQGTDINKIIDLVLTGRAKSLTNLLALHKFMQLPFESGIRCLVGTVLHRTLTKMLCDRGAIPPEDAAGRQTLLQELESRS